MKPLKTVKVTPTNIDNTDVRQLYETAFPVEEQIPYDDYQTIAAGNKLMTFLATPLRKLRDIR